MTDQEILKKAIEKALHNNWEQMLPFVPTWALEQANEDRLTQHIIKTYGRSIIFSHDFAKAFWGERGTKEFLYCNCDERDFTAVEGYEAKTCRNCGFVGKLGEEVLNEGWQYHLQQMVLEEKSLSYLTKFL